MVKTKAPRKVKREKPADRWRELFALIPGYNPVATATPDDYFDADAAERAVRFFPDKLKHVEGKLAGQPYELAPWEQAIVGCLFGWKNADGLRRYRQAFIYVAKKNSKSTLSAGLALYGLCEDGEPCPKIFSAAASRDQAALIFNTMVGMIKLNPEHFRGLRPYGDKGGSQQRAITNTANMGSYRPLAADADTADGLNVYMAIVDELHRHPNGKLLDILIRGTSAREQPLVVIITTADYDRESACNQKHAEACRVRDNGGDPEKPGYNPRFLPVIFEASKDDDWTDPKVWAKANPNLGRSKSIEYMREACESAKHDPVARNEFLRFDLNIRTQQTEALIDLTQWDACPATIDPAKLKGRRCFGGLDMGRRDDIAALCWAFEPLLPDGVWDFVWRFWSPAKTVRRREHEAVPYRVWVDGGWLTATPGDDVDFGSVQTRLREDFEAFEAAAVGYDPASITQMTQELFNQYGVKVLPVRQGTLTLNEPTLLMLSLIRAGRLGHGGNPVMRWMAGNAMDRRDHNGNVMADKEQSKDKIDGISATVNALRVFLDQPETGSMYERMEC